MKANKDFRPSTKDSIYEPDDVKKGKKLTPDKKPKNEKLYDVDDFDEEYDLHKYKRESISDFYDNGEEEGDSEDYDEEDFDEEESDEYQEDDEDEIDNKK